MERLHVPKGIVTLLENPHLQRLVKPLQSIFPGSIDNSGCNWLLSLESQITETSCLEIHFPPRVCLFFGELAQGRVIVLQPTSPQRVLREHATWITVARASVWSSSVWLYLHEQQFMFWVSWNLCLVHLPGN